MKKIEDLFRSALKDQEFPYDESAWNDMSKRLDARGGSAGQLKWIIGAAVVASITIGSILYVNNKETHTRNTTDPKLASNGKEFESNSTEGNNELIDNVTDSQTFEDPQTTENIPEKIINTKSKVIVSEKEELIIEEIPCCGDDEPVAEEILVPPVYREVLIKEEEKETIATAQEESLVFPPVSNHCLNDEWIYSNKNTKSIWVNTP